MQSTGSPWSAHPQQNFQTDQPPAFGGLAPQYYPPPGSFSGYQRHFQQGPYSARTTASGNLYFGNANAAAHVPRNQPNTTYAQQFGQQFDSRSNRDAYQAPPGLQIPIPTSSTTIASIQPQSFLSSSTEVSGDAGDVGSETSQPHRAPQGQQIQSSAGQYGFHPISMHSSGQPYQPSPHPGTQSVVYDQTGQSHVVKFEEGHFHSAQSLYSDHPREPFPATTSTLAEASLSLDAGMLNRSYAPPQAAPPQAVYDAVAEQDLGGFKQQPDPYPTPNQTSPMGSLP